MFVIEIDTIVSAKIRQVQDAIFYIYCVCQVAPAIHAKADRLGTRVLALLPFPHSPTSFQLGAPLDTHLCNFRKEAKI
jgi:hypothetical protein